MVEDNEVSDEERDSAQANESRPESEEEQAEMISPVREQNRPERLSESPQVGRGSSSGHPAKRLEEVEKQARLVWEWLDGNELVLLADLADLLNQGLTPAQAIDWMAMEWFEYGQTEWGEIRGVSRQTIQNNYSRAKEQLDDA